MKKETKRAIRDAFAKLSFRSQAQNPVMLMVYLSACLTTVLLALALAGISDAPWGYIAAICVVLWATVLFGNFAESLAEGRGKVQADALRSAKRDVEACLIDNARPSLMPPRWKTRRRFLLIEAARWDRLR